jgi:alkylated DNA repair dioxygenase AlkB
MEKVSNCFIERGIMPFKLNREEYDQLWDSHPLQRSVMIIFNKKIRIPRWQQAYGKTYSFASMEEEAKPLTKQLQKYIDWANTNEINKGRPGGLNGILINWYEDGEHYIGWHSDNTTWLDDESSIYTISLGAKRTFKIREKKDKKNVTNYELDNNDFLIMGGEFQKYYQHHLPKRKRCKESRISITIRKFV